MWTARILKAMPAIQAGHPTARFIFLTLTVRNCELSELRSTIKAMGQAFNNLQRRKEWPAIGWIRATEVTRGKDDSAHPHFHCLLMVEPGYFRGQAYLSQAKWVELWRSALKVTYEPSVHVRVVRPNKRDGLQGQKQATESTFATDTQSLSAAVVETLKYSVKPSDLLGSGTEADRLWLVELTTQLHKTRGVAIGGVLKQYLSESEPEDLVTESDHGELLENKSLWFGWREQVQRYAKQDY
jgi:plasmid rolling circle replication initiator protein Rep